MSGPRVPGASVYVEWTTPGGSIYTDVRVTKDPQGFAAFKLNYWESGTYILCVTDVTKAGFTYDPSLNPSDCAAITVP